MKNIGLSQHLIVMLLSRYNATQVTYDSAHPKG
jgi:hypothetical protein